jgi:hypothetical protein
MTTTSLQAPRIGPTRMAPPRDIPPLWSEAFPPSTAAQPCGGAPFSELPMQRALCLPCLVVQRMPRERGVSALSRSWRAPPGASSPRRTRASCRGVGGDGGVARGSRDRPTHPGRSDPTAGVRGRSGDGRDRWRAIKQQEVLDACRRKTVFTECDAVAAERAVPGAVWHGVATIGTPDLQPLP